MGVREREGPEISALSNRLEDVPFTATGKTASWVGMDRNHKFHFGYIIFELHMRIPSGDNIRQLEPGERSGLER